MCVCIKDTQFDISKELIDVLYIYIYIYIYIFTKVDSSQLKLIFTFDFI